MSESKNALIIPTTASDDVSFVRVLNPFNPRERVTNSMPWESQKPLIAYLAEQFVDVYGEREHYVASINGRLIEQEQWSDVFPGPGDSVVLCPIPGGSDSGKTALRIVALIALTMWAPTAGQAIAGYVGWGTASGWGMVVLVGGSLLINAALPPPKPTVPDEFQDADDTYGVDGAKNTVADGITIPVCYGRYRMGHNLIGLHAENDGNNQILYMLFNAGEGPIGGITGILINDQPMSNFLITSADLQIKLGTENQTPPSWFSDTVIPINQNSKLTTEFVHRTTINEVDRLRVDFICNGLVKYSDRGEAQDAYVEIEMYYRKVGTETWNKFIVPERTTISTDSYEYLTDVDGNTVYDDISGEPVWVYKFTWNPCLIGKTTTTVRKSFWTPDLEQGQYEIKYRRVNEEGNDGKTIDVCTLTDINEIINDNIRYKYTALLAVRIRQTSQLSGIPKVTYINLGRMIKVWDAVAEEWTTEASNNPAWIAYDILTNTRYGGGLAESRLDLVAWKDWAQFCDDYGLTFQGVFDADSNVWDQIQHVFRCGRAQLIPSGTRYTISIERYDTPVMMFGVGNIIEGTFNTEWLPIADRANEIEGAFFDETDDEFKRQTVKIYDQAAIDRGLPQKTASVDLVGVTNVRRAWQELSLLMNMNRYILQSVTFETWTEALACTIGDLIYVQHDMPQWGYGGRLETGSTTTVLNLDREVEMEAGKLYKLLITFDALQRASGSVTSIIGTSLYLSNYYGSTNVKRIQVAGKDLKILSTFSNGVVVESVAGIAVGSTYVIWDTDVIEERDVVNVPGTTTALTVQVPFSDVPPDFANWMFGETTKMKKIFRVRSISGSHEYTRTVGAVEYNESVYDFNESTIPTPNYSALDFAVGQVEIDGVTEELIRVNNVVRTRCTIRWTPSSGLYDGADIYLGHNSAILTNVGQVRSGATSFSVEAEDNDRLYFKIVAVDPVGGKAAYNNAPTYTHDVVGKLAPPSQVQNFTAQKAVGGVLLQWDANEDLDILGYEIRYGTSWDDSTVLVTEHASTRFTAEVHSAGEHRYHIKAIDTSKVRSAEVTSVSITLQPPTSVRDFVAVQNGGTINFRWSPNPEDDIVAYEIREGSSWSEAVFVARTDTNTHSTTSEIPGSHFYWIKAIDSIGLRSAIAVFSSTEVARSDDRNLLYNVDEMSSGFANTKFNVNVDPIALTLVLDDEYRYGEYTFPVNLPAVFRARSIINAAMSAVLANSPTWAEATFSWASEDADVAWVRDGDINNVGLTYQLSVKLASVPVEVVEGFSMSDTLVGINATAPAEQLGVSYQPGRFLNGLSVSDLTRVSWSVALPSTFNTRFWIIPTEVVDAVYWSATDTGKFLQVGYRLRDKSFYLEDLQGNIIVVPFDLQANQRVLIAVVQTATARKLFVGKADSTDVWVKGEAAIPSNGAYTSIRLYGAFE